MICEQNDSDTAAMAAIQQQLAQKEQELLLQQQVQSRLQTELEKCREITMQSESRAAGLTAELASAGEKCLAAEAAADASAQSASEARARSRRTWSSCR